MRLSMLRLWNRGDFEKLVAEAVAALPPVVKGRHGKRGIHRRAGSARDREASQMHIKKGTLLLGLYEGVSKAKPRRHLFQGMLPDKIPIFERPIRDARQERSGKTSGNRIRCGAATKSVIILALTKRASARTRRHAKKRECEQ